MALRVRREGIRDRYRERSMAAAADYVAGATDPATAWAAPTAAAESFWSDRVREAADAGRFAAGVVAAGDAKYKDRIAAVGLARYRTGVDTGADAYEEAMEPFLDALEALTLDPRTGDLDLDVVNRVLPVCRAMQAVAGR